MPKKTPKPQTINLLTPGEVAALFRVNPKTVTRWAAAGKLTTIRTLGNHRRYVESEIRALLNFEAPVYEMPAPETPKLAIVPAEAAPPAEWRAGLFGETVTVEGEAIVYRNDGALTKFKDDFPDGIDLQRMAANLAEKGGRTFIEVAS